MYHAIFYWYNSKAGTILTHTMSDEHLGVYPVRHGPADHIEWMCCIYGQLALHHISIPIEDSTPWESGNWWDSGGFSSVVN